MWGDAHVPSSTTEWHPTQPTHPPSHVRARAPHGPSGVEDACVWMHARRRRGESTGQVKAAGKLRVNSSSGGFTLARCSPAAPRVCQQPLPFYLFTPPPPPLTRLCMCGRACRSQREITAWVLTTLRERAKCDFYYIFSSHVLERSVDWWCWVDHEPTWPQFAHLPPAELMLSGSEYPEHRLHSTFRSGY